MSRSSEPGGDRAQHSVAELLARYGETAPSTGRRRRRESDAGDTAPQSIIQRVKTDSGPTPTTGRAARRRAAESESDAAANGYPLAESPHGFPTQGSHGSAAGTAPPEKPEWANYSWNSFTGGTGSHSAARSDSTRAADPVHRNGSGPGRQYETSRNDYDGGFTGSWSDGGSGFRNDRTMRGPGPAAVDGRDRSERNGRPPGPAEPDLYRNGHDQGSWSAASPLNGFRRPFGAPQTSDGPSTEQIPRLDPVSFGTQAEQAAAPSAPSVPGAPPPPPVSRGVQAPPESMPTQAWQAAPDEVEVEQAPPPPAMSRPPAGGPPAGLGAPTQAIPQPDLDDEVDYLPDGVAGLEDAELELAELDEEYDDEEYVSPVREWAVMATQIGVGVIGGAGLWLICEWLWQRIPVVALVVALAVITGLVWVVRRVRRAEDLQTTVIAVLVGLFVTVSPAALLLVGR